MASSTNGNQRLAGDELDFKGERPDQQSNEKDEGSAGGGPL